MTQEKQLARVLDKARRLERTYEARIFTRLLDMPMEAFSCTEHLYAPPEDAAYAPIACGDIWGGAWQSLWLRGMFTVPEALAGRPLYVLPRLGGWEGFLFLDGVPHAIFTNKYTTETHGNHYAARITPGAAAGTVWILSTMPGTISPAAPLLRTLGSRIAAISTRASTLPRGTRRFCAL